MHLCAGLRSRRWHFDFDYCFPARAWQFWQFWQFWHSRVRLGFAYCFTVSARSSNEKNQGHSLPSTPAAALILLISAGLFAYLLSYVHRLTMPTRISFFIIPYSVVWRSLASSDITFASSSGIFVQASTWRSLVLAFLKFVAYSSFGSG